MFCRVACRGNLLPLTDQKKKERKKEKERKKKKKKEKKSRGQSVVEGCGGAVIFERTESAT